MTKTKKQRKTMKAFRLKEEVANKLEEDAKAQGVSETKHLENLIMGKKISGKRPTLKQITTKYEGTCNKCGDPIPIGSTAYWSKDVIICNECYLNRKIEELGDKVLAKKYLKTRELNKIIRALKSKADHYADLVLEKEYEVRFMDVLRKWDQLGNLVNDYLRNLVTSPQEKELLNKMDKLSKELGTEWEELKMVTKAKFEPLKKKGRPRQT